MTGSGDDPVWEGAPRRRRHRPPGHKVDRRVIVLAVVGVVALLGLLLSAPQERGEVMQVPRELGGRWGTDQAAYQDRRLIIEPEGLELTLDAGPEGRMRHPIVEFRGWEEGDRRGYRIHYDTPEGEQVLEVYVMQDGTLRLKNPSEVVWRRVR